MKLRLPDKGDVGVALACLVFCVGIPGGIIYLTATSDPAPDEPIAAPAYDPSCVVESPTVGCVDQATYDAVVTNYNEGESSGYEDDDGPDYQGRAR